MTESVHYCSGLRDGEQPVANERKPVEASSPVPLSQQLSVLVVDWRQERGEVLCTLLAPHVDVAIDDGRSRRSRPTDLLVIDPSGQLHGRWRLRLHSSLRNLPALVLGDGNGYGETTRYLPGAIDPQHLISAIERLFGSHRQRDPTAELADTIPLATADRALLMRVATTAAPVLLYGEPGTGKSRIARSLLTTPESAFVRLKPSEPLAEQLSAAGEDATVYLSTLENLSATEQMVLVDHLHAPWHGPRVIMAAWTAEPHVCDDLRLLLLPVSIELAPLRSQKERVASVFERAVGALAVSHGVDPPTSLAALEGYLGRSSWPLNFDEMVALATRVLFHASGRPATLADIAQAPTQGRPVATVREQNPNAASPQPEQRRRVSLTQLPRKSEDVAEKDSEAVAKSPDLGSLVTELAHEIRNPLVSIKTFTQLLSERFGDPEFRGQYFRIVSSEIDRIEAALMEMQQFAHLKHPRWSPVDACAALRRVIESHSFLFRKRGVTVREQFTSDPTTVETDPILLGYAVDNIIREAIDSVAEGQTLELGLDNSDGPKLSLHYRTQAARDGTEGGERRARQVLGLRHALAALALQRMGGSLEVEDTLEGESFVSVKLS